MKITNFKDKILYYPIITIFLLSLASTIVSCGPFKPKYTDLRKIPGDPKEKREKTFQMDRKCKLKIRKKTRKKRR